MWGQSRELPAAATQGFSGVNESARVLSALVSRRSAATLAVLVLERRELLAETPPTGARPLIVHGLSERRRHPVWG